MEKRGGKRSGAGRPKTEGVEHRWIVPQDIHDIAKSKGIQYIWDAVRFRTTFDFVDIFNKKASIVFYPSYAHIEYVDKEFGLMSCDIEFENLSFESKEEKQEWINDILVDYCPFVDNYDEIEQALSDALDKYVKVEY